MPGKHRLSQERLEAWEKLGYGMFVHFGMGTAESNEYSQGNQPSGVYAPDKLDVGQWIRTASEAGMKYAVLTTKHVSGHCLWPSEFTDYHVGTSGNPTDVVREFTEACRREGIMPGLYYCSWDNHHTFGSKTPAMTSWANAFTTERYQEFQREQIMELLTNYGAIGEVWVDIPHVLPRGYRHQLYDDIASLQPDALIVFNYGITDGSGFMVNEAWPVEGFMVNEAWPTDIITIERFLPPSRPGHKPLREIEGEQYYLPGEVCETIGHTWFYQPNDKLRSDEELLGLYLVSRARGANFLLDVPPDMHGLIPECTVAALLRLKHNIAKFTNNGSLVL
jgi:alpha-L-fucosidase